MSIKQKWLGLCLAIYFLSGCIAGIPPRLIQDTPVPPGHAEPFSPDNSSPSTPIPHTTNPIPDFPLNLGNTWVYSATYYDTYETERITLTAIITETVVATQTQSPHFAANLRRDRDVISTSDNLAGKDWEQHYLGGSDNTYSFWYVISGSQVYEQPTLDWSAIETDDAVLQYIFPLSSSVVWYPDPWQREQFPNFAVPPGLRRVSNPFEITVPAGRFQNCFEIITMYNSGATFSSFCSAIGLVGSHYDHAGTPFGYRITLIDCAAKH